MRDCVIVVMTVFLLASCGPQRKLSVIRSGDVAPEIVPGRDVPPPPALENPQIARDTFTVTGDDGREVFIMKAVRDEDGEMVAHDVLDAAVVSARFRNVAERCGRVELSFRLSVPPSMMDSRWQIRLFPELRLASDSLSLEPVIITGLGYRKSQLRGYQQYERFLSRIVSDTSEFINVRDLEMFLKRNLPEVYALKTDSTWVSDDELSDRFGVGEKEAVDHYTDHLAMRLNAWRVDRRPKMYKRYVRSPIMAGGVRLDSVMVDDTGAFVYDYVQVIDTRPGLRKAEIVMDGEIMEQDRRVYSIPSTPPLTFYISSLSSFADMTERYLTKVIERRAEANTACYVDFEPGRSVLDEDVSHNREELGRIRRNIAELLENRTYDLDSVVVMSSASPEGRLAANDRLSLERSRAVSAYLDRYIAAYNDSLSRERGVSVDEDGRVSGWTPSVIPFVSRSASENWTMLDALVRADTLLTENEKKVYFSLSGTRDPDRREALLSGEPFYLYLRQSLYPRLRTVRFNFFLHRKDMVKDTVHTTVPDTLYMRGVRALVDSDYATALSVLAPYADYNAAVAYVALGRNASALAILPALQRTARVNYLMAIIHCREGRIKEALECYTRACDQDGSYVHRGNLDPEISALIRSYGLNRTD